MSARRISILSAVLLAAAWSAMLSGPRAHLGRAVAETDPPGKTLADKPPAPSAADSLCEDGRVGRIVEVQGVVLIKPPMQRRWTPVCGPGILQPGDWVRTDARGANAVELRLTTGRA